MNTDEVRMVSITAGIRSVGSVSTYDLFGVDRNGVVYRYNFEQDKWFALPMVVG